jgi:hypothetical protein
VIGAGDLITWRTWCGSTVALVESLRADGTASIRSADGHSEFFEQLPRAAELASPEQVAWWAERARPAFPPGYH